MTDSLRAFAQQQDFYIGTAVSEERLSENSPYKETVEREFNVVAAENDMKFHHVQPAYNKFDFSKADRIVDFATQNNMAIRGHTLVWGGRVPTWLEAGDWSREEVISILEKHIKTTVGRYRGKIQSWDVVNESLDKDGNVQDSFWLRKIGPEYIEMAFRWAHEADPDALLMYNDYNIEGLNPKSGGLYRLIEDLQSKGVPIDGVGLQMHFTQGAHPSAKDVGENIARLAELGMKVHVTEMDVRIEQPITAEKLASQAKTYREMIEVCIEAENCDTVIIWGVSDRYSWIPSTFRNFGSAVLFDRDYQPKPAYEAVSEALETSLPIVPPAQPLVVSTLTDEIDPRDGLVSLREAIAFAEEGDTITFARNIPDGNNLVLNQSLQIDRDITIDGQDRNITVSGDGFDLVRVRGAAIAVRNLDFAGGEDAFSVTGKESFLTLENLEIIEASDDSIELKNASKAAISLSNVVLFRSGDEGIEVRNSDRANISLVNNSKIQQSGADGIDIVSNNATINLTESELSENSSSGLRLSNSKNAAIQIRNSRLNNNRDVILHGTDQNDKLVGSSADDVIWGNTGDDELMGGGGSDRFVITPGDGRDRITDFDIRNDIIDVTALGISSLSELRLTGDTIGFDGSNNEAIALSGIDTTQLSSDNFSF